MKKSKPSVGHYVPLFPSSRLLMILLLCMGVGIFESMELTLNFAWVCMVPRANHSTPNASQSGTTTPAPYDPSPYKVHWGKAVQTIVFVSGAVTALIVHFPAGWFIDHFGAKMIMGSGAVAMAVMSCLVPTLARYSFWYLVLYKAILVMPYAPIGGCINNVCSQWSAKEQIGLSFMLAMNGFQLGPFALMLLSGLECDTIGWQWVFYLIGIFSLLFALLWFVFYSNDPETSWITPQREVDYLLANRIREAKTATKTPVKAILTSAPVWAFAVCGICSLWCNIVLRSYSPIFLAEILHIDPTHDGYYSALPYVAQLVSRTLAGPLSDRPLFGLSRTRVIKLFTAFSLYGCAAGFVAMTFITSRTPPLLAVGMIVACMFMITFDTGGFLKSLLYIAPEHAAVINSLTYWIATFCAAAEIFFIGWETGDYLDSEWRVIFAVCAGVCVVAGTIFMIFGSGELQPWAQSGGTEAAEYSAKSVLPSSDVTLRAWEMPRSEFYDDYKMRI